jgi:hypothetical protein
LNPHPLNENLYCKRITLIPKTSTWVWRPHWLQQAVVLGQHPYVKGANGSDGFLACLASRPWRKSHLLFAFMFKAIVFTISVEKLIIRLLWPVQFDHMHSFLGMNLCLNQTNKECPLRQSTQRE